MARYSIGADRGCRGAGVPIESDEKLRELLERTRTIAVVGIKDGCEEDAYRVPAYPQRNGYRIVPVNPKLERVLGERAVASLRDSSEPVDLVDLFRAPEHVPAHVDEILALSPRPCAVWMQLGISHPEAARRLEAAGIAVVENRCILVEHRRLLGRR
jgi:predicted CoA-binding protein